MGPHMLWQQLHKTLYELFDIGCDSCICCDSGYCFDTVLVCIVSYIYIYIYIHTFCIVMHAVQNGLVGYSVADITVNSFC